MISEDKLKRKDVRNIGDIKNIKLKEWGKPVCRSINTRDTKSGSISAPFEDTVFGDNS
jgi:hypothetical protein